MRQNHRSKKSLKFREFRGRKIVYGEILTPRKQFKPWLSVLDCLCRWNLQVKACSHNQRCIPSTHVSRTYRFPVIRNCVHKGDEENVNSVADAQCSFCSLFIQFCRRPTQVSVCILLLTPCYNKTNLLLSDFFGPFLVKGKRTQMRRDNPKINPEEGAERFKSPERLWNSPLAIFPSMAEIRTTFWSFQPSLAFTYRSAKKRDSKQLNRNSFTGDECFLELQFSLLSVAVEKFEF